MTRGRFEIERILAAAVVLAGVGLAVTRVAADAPEERYDVADGTVHDKETRLTWQQTVPPMMYASDVAAAYCKKNMAGLPGTGWRLPTLTELQTIVDDSQSMPAADSSAFPGTPSDRFWTSSAFVGTPGQAWYVDFTGGTTFYVAASTPFRVRCVR